MSLVIREVSLFSLYFNLNGKISKGQKVSNPLKFYKNVMPSLAKTAGNFFFKTSLCIMNNPMFSCWYMSTTEICFSRKMALTALNKTFKNSYRNVTVNAALVSKFPSSQLDWTNNLQNRLTAPFNLSAINFLVTHPTDELWGLEHIPWKVRAFLAGWGRAEFKYRWL